MGGKRDEKVFEGDSKARVGSRNKELNEGVLCCGMVEITGTCCRDRERRQCNPYSGRNEEGCQKSELQHPAQVQVTAVYRMDLIRECMRLEVEAKVGPKRKRGVGDKYT